MDHYKQLNTNIGFAQTGSAGAGKASLVIGAREGRITKLDYDKLRTALMNAGNPDFNGAFDDFNGNALSTQWATDLSTGATAAVNAQAGGVLRVATDTDDDDHATIARGLYWPVNTGFLFFEARIKCVTAITLRALEVGLSDAVSETNGLAFSAHGATPTAVATDAAIFGYDTDASMTTWAINTVKADTAASTVLTAAPSTSFQKLGIVINTSGDAYFYVNGALVGSKTSAVATTAVLTPWISLKSLSAAAKTIDIDYILVAGTR